MTTTVFFLCDEVTSLLSKVGTLDFFTPIVDDPASFGAVAAANALSDVYAMGAKPIFALNIVGFPSNRLSPDVLAQILRGGQDKCMEAGVPVLGGHTVEDLEPKYGLAVIGAPGLYPVANLLDTNTWGPIHRPTSCFLCAPTVADNLMRNGSGDSSQVFSHNRVVYNIF